MKIRILTFIAMLVLALSCKKEIPCVETCGWQQDCIEGECTCPDGTYEIDNRCKESRENYFFGNLDCGCYGPFIIDLSLLGTDDFQLIFGTGSSTTNITLESDSTYNATFSKSCNFDGTFAEFVDFTVVKISETKIDVHSRWWTITDGTLAECEGVFTH